VGGESGPKARPFYLDWLEPLIHSTQNRWGHGYGTPLFIKQIGDAPYLSRSDFGEPVGRLAKPAASGGSDPAEWPARYRIRQTPDCFSLQPQNLETATR
jgi:hypothetical protein